MAVKRTLASRVFGRLVKFFFLCLLLTVLGLFAWRWFSSETPAAMKGVRANQTLCEVYAQNPDTVFFKQGHITVTRDAKCYGYFGVTQVIMIPEAEQVQVVFRLNRSTLTHLCEDYGLDEIPPIEGLYDLTVVRTYFEGEIGDETSLGEERIHPTDAVYQKKNIYYFMQLTFDGVRIDDTTAALFLDVYFKDDIDYENEAYGTLLLYDYTTERKPYEPSKKEIKALECR